VAAQTIHQIPTRNGIQRKMPDMYGPEKSP